MPTVPAPFHLVLAAAAGLALGACDTPETLSDDFGNAVRHNKAVHIIDPAPRYATAVAPSDARRTSRALTRYHTGVVTSETAAKADTSATMTTE